MAVADRKETEKEKKIKRRWLARSWLKVSVDTAIPVIITIIRTNLRVVKGLKVRKRKLKLKLDKSQPHNVSRRGLPKEKAKVEAIKAVRAKARAREAVVQVQPGRAKRTCCADII